LCRFMAVPAFVLATYASPAFAEPPGCREYRQSIIDLRTAPLQARKWRLFDLYLEVHYRKYCSRAYRLQPQQVWHKTDGTATAASATSGRPPGGAYTTTKEHGKICATAGSPSVCALMLDAAYLAPEIPGEAVEALPTSPTYIDGVSTLVQGVCVNALQMLEVVAAALETGIKPSQSSKTANIALATLESDCPNLLETLIERTGVTSPHTNTDAFAKGVGAILEGVDGSVETAKRLVASSDPGFQRMCTEAGVYRNQCALRQSTMGELGTVSSSKEGQAGEFGSCAELYEAVLATCRANGVHVLENHPEEAGVPEVSDKCESLAASYAKTAKAGNGQQAYADFQALKQSCPQVVDAIAEKTNIKYPVHSPFPTRSMGTMTEDLMGGCLNTSDVCASEADRLASGTTDQAQGALLRQSVTFGLAVANVISQTGTVAQALSVPSDKTDMTSLTQGVTGQGTPAAPVQTNNGPKPTSSISESGPGSGTGEPSSVGTAQ
jgi:hypothetical protein